MDTLESQVPYCSFLLISFVLLPASHSLFFPLGDTAFLLSPVTVYKSGVTVPLIEYMTQRLALNSLSYPNIAPGLADYGPNPNTFLEYVKAFVCLETLEAHLSLLIDVFRITFTLLHRSPQRICGCSLVPHRGSVR